MLAVTQATAEQQAVRAALLVGPDWRLERLVSAIGHRAPFDYELAVPRYCERPDEIESVARRMLDSDAGLARSDGFDVRRRSAGRAAPLPRALMDAAGRARRFELLKEDAKHHMLRELAGLRQLLLAIDRRLGLRGAVFELTLDEVELLNARTAVGWRQRAAVRRSEREALEAVPSLPPRLSVRDIETGSAGSAVATAPVAAGALGGTRVAGSGVAAGRAIVVAAEVAEAGGEIDGFENGDIIVCRMVPPSWLPYVLRSGGVVSELGGWLSHMAIVARERDIVMMVGCVGTSAIPTGSLLRLHPEGRIEIAGPSVGRADGRLAAE
jgi:phosphohistidine swiveling domain-containing protein